MSFSLDLTTGLPSVSSGIPGRPRHEKQLYFHVAILKGRFGKKECFEDFATPDAQRKYSIWCKYVGIKALRTSRDCKVVLQQEMYFYVFSFIVIVSFVLSYCSIDKDDFRIRDNVRNRYCIRLYTVQPVMGRIIWCFLIATLNCIERRRVQSASNIKC